jgi:hypothetical protein
MLILFFLDLADGDIQFWIVSPICGAISAIDSIQESIPETTLDYVSDLNISDFLRVYF